MVKASRSLRKSTKGGKGKPYILFAFVILIIGIAMLVQGGSYSMSVFEATNDHWSGELSIAGFTEDGQTYRSETSLPRIATQKSWGTDSVAADIDGSVRFYGYAGLGSSEINTDLDESVNYPQLEGYPTAKPKLTWTIVDNMRHVDVNDNYLVTGVPSVTTQENGLLIEVYYYTFSVKLELEATKVVEHDWYAFAISGFPVGTRYMYDLAPLRGLYLLPQITLTPKNESIIDMGSDMATFGSTQWKFYNAESPSVEVASSQVEDEFASEILGFNRDFFMAGGDSGAGLNIFNKVDENTNQFSVGFVKVGIPAITYGSTLDEAFNTMQTKAYNVELVIPLRMSVIVAYDIPYTGSDIYEEGEEDVEEQDYFKRLEGEITEFAIAQGIEEDMIPYVVVGAGIVILLVVSKSRRDD